MDFFAAREVYRRTTNKPSHRGNKDGSLAPADILHVIAKSSFVTLMATNNLLAGKWAETFLCIVEMDLLRYLFDEAIDRHKISGEEICASQDTFELNEDNVDSFTVV